MAGSSQGDRSGLGIFAAELAAARAAAGLTQEELASRVTFSASTISMVEQRRRVPSADLARRCDEVLGLPGTLRRLQEHAQAVPLPAWFRPYAEVEAAATVLRSWQPMVIDGLAQTEDYARAAGRAAGHQRRPARGPRRGPDRAAGDPDPVRAARRDDDHGRGGTDPAGRRPEGDARPAQLLAETGRTTTKPIARFKVRKPEPPCQRHPAQGSAIRH